MKPEDKIGEIHGDLIIIEIDRKWKHGTNKIYKCKCTKCGKIGIYAWSDIKKNPTCHHLNVKGYIYNPTFKWKNERLGQIFSSMKDRCYNPKCPSYRWYGNKNINIFDLWMERPEEFEIWAFSNGYNDNLSIDRIDPNKDYCPENCRWITLKENSRFKSSTNRISVDGEVHSGHEWGHLLGIGTNTINVYMRKYGEEKTVEFIKRFINNPTKKEKRNPRQSYFDIYM